MEGTKRKRDDDHGDTSLPKKAKNDNDKENIVNDRYGVVDDPYSRFLKVFAIVVDNLFPNSWNKSKKQCARALNSCKQDILLGKQTAATGGKTKSVYVGTSLSRQVEAILKRLKSLDKISDDEKTMMDALEIVASPSSTNTTLDDNKSSLASALASLAAVTFESTEPDYVKIYGICLTSAFMMR